MHQKFKRHLFVFCAMSVCIAANSQTSLTPAQQSQVNTMTGAMSSVSTPEFRALRDNTAKQAAAVAQSAMAAPQKYNTELMRSGVVERVAQASASGNKELLGGIGKEQIDRVKSLLPSLNQIGSDLKYGKFVVVSDKGEEIILLIRSIPVRAESERSQILMKIKAYSEQGYPEALNFMGFIFEYGLFGAIADINKAKAFYEAAAKRRYQPALFNLANIYFFGKLGRRNYADAEKLIAQAHAIGIEGSYRVCGLGSFLQYRIGNRQDALAYGKACASALANLPNAEFREDLAIGERVKMLRESIAAGADDGYAMLEKVTLKTAGDRDYLYCKYKLINQIRLSGDLARLKEMGSDCYSKTTRDLNTKEERARAEMALNGITGFVSVELGLLARAREANRFHYSWSAPYLPFGQAEVDLFEPLLPKGKK